MMVKHDLEGSDRVKGIYICQNISNYVLELCKVLVLQLNLYELLFKNKQNRYIHSLAMPSNPRALESAGGNPLEQPVPSRIGPLLFHWFALGCLLTSSMHGQAEST